MVRKYLFTIFLGILLFAPDFAHAQSLSESVNTQFNAGAGSAGFATGTPKDPRVIIAETIQMLLGILGMVFIVLIVTAGYWYLTAAGDEDKVEKAKKTISGSIIGIIILLGAYSITTFVAKRIQNAVQKEKVYEVETGPAPFAPGGSKQYELYNYKNKINP